MKQWLAIICLSLFFCPSLEAARIGKLKKHKVGTSPCEVKAVHNLTRELNLRAEAGEILAILDDTKKKKSPTKEREFSELKRAGELAPILEGRYIHIDPRLDRQWSYVRPWAGTFVLDIGKEYFEVFEEKLQVNSAARTPKKQKALSRGGNGNADCWSGDATSLHVFGIAVDFAKKPMTSEQIRWMQGKLASLGGQGVVSVEEHRQAVFHVVIFKEYKERREE